MIATKHSKRASLFYEVLQYINNGDWERLSDFLVFGKEAFDRYTGASLNDACGLEDGLRRVVSKVKVSRGNTSVKKRISVGPLPLNPPGQDVEDVAEELKAWLSHQTAASRAEFLKDLSRDSTMSDVPLPTFSTRAEDPDDRDACLAFEAIEWLNEASARLATLDETEVSRGTVSYAEYFEEAHRCNLAGLKIASAVLCRAVLERALEQSVNSKGEIDRYEKGYISRMLDIALNLKILDDERFDSAKEIKKAGDAAIHNPQVFRRYSGRMNHIVDNTRKVVADLYGSLEHGDG